MSTIHRNVFDDADEVPFVSPPLLLLSRALSVLFLPKAVGSARFREVRRRPGPPRDDDDDDDDDDNVRVY